MLRFPRSLAAPSLANMDVFMVSRARHPIRTVLALLSTSVVVGLAFAGCGASSASLCDDICACQGCSDSERDDCEDNLDDLGKHADEMSCPDAYDVWLSCLNDQVACRDGKVDLDGCESEADALEQCVGGAILGASSACHELVAECGGNPSSCDSAKADCVSQCIFDSTENHCDVTQWTPSQATAINMCSASC